MKKILIITMAFVWFFGTSTLFGISLQEALKKNMISISIQGNGDHVGKCIDLTIKNNHYNVQNIFVECRQLLASKNHGTQDMIFTERMVIPLPIHGSAKSQLYAMCAQKNNSSPGRNDQFIPGKMATGNLLALSKLIEALHYQNSAGQSAIWAITDHSSIDYIRGSDSIMVATLQNFVAQAKGIPVPYAGTNRMVPSSSPSKKVYRITGKFIYTLTEASKVSISLFDIDGNEIKKVMEERTASPGSQKLNYSFETIQKIGKRAYLCLIINGNTLRKKMVYFSR